MGQLGYSSLSGLAGTARSRMTSFLCLAVVRLVGRGDLQLEQLGPDPQSLSSSSRLAWTASHCNLRVPKSSKRTKSSTQVLHNLCTIFSNFPLARANRLISPDSRDRGMPTLIAWWMTCAKLRGKREPGMLEDFMWARGARVEEVRSVRRRGHIMKHLFSKLCWGVWSLSWRQEKSHCKMLSSMLT